MTKQIKKKKKKIERIALKPTSMSGGLTKSGGQFLLTTPTINSEQRIPVVPL